jgi:gamma-glutamyltranspeptidase/glutathione hydrolase
MASYRAREVEPLSIEWLGHTIHTAPLTAGGATIIETLSILKALDATGKQLGSAHARVEALRVAWSDRLRFFGDPTQADVPVDRLLSAAYAEAMAARVAEAVEQRKPLDISTDATPQDGTVNLSAADDDGNFATVTFTHGGSFGAKVTVPGLGLTLGHGVSRFDPRAWHPNSPGPSKRPLHNMCPTVVVHDGRAWLAVGGAGGRRIPNGVFDVLTGVLMGRSVEQAVAAPRMNTTGDLDLRLEEAWPADDVEAFRGMGYAVQTGGGARISAAFGDPASGALATARR